jgi:hypothetical protein
MLSADEAERLLTKLEAANQASNGLAGLKNDAAPLPAAMDRHRERRIVLSARRCAVNFARLPELRKSKR